MNKNKKIVKCVCGAMIILLLSGEFWVGECERCHREHHLPRPNYETSAGSISVSSSNAVFTSATTTTAYPPIDNYRSQDGMFI